ncbi:GDSL-type esterase/lipase family protein [Hugenholtzia roseola]|uniref:GDSL-type esterase/lipase family protein n=1 Tax=Hugenholtzia roseola TaxID=1002 RepID=UPI00042586C0|nr:GDSL-type esterase/lipase family protein [Hugenholtzia roseola]
MKILLSAFLFFLTFPALFAQERNLEQAENKNAADPFSDSVRRILYGDLPHYQVIDYGANDILFSQYLEPFFKALQDLQNKKRRQVHILHIGDSHLQADFFTGEVRRRLQADARFGEAGRGFVFPYNVAKTNNPLDYKVSYTGVWEGFRSALPRQQSRWGLAGVTAQTYQSSATFAIKLQTFKGKSPIGFNKIRIYYPLQDSTQFEPTLHLASSEILSRKVSNEGYMEYTLRQVQTELNLGLVKTEAGQKRFLLQGVWLENTEQAGILYSAVGVNGADSKTYLRCEDFEPHLRSLAPDLVVISLGTNDAYATNFNESLYQANLEFLIAQIRKNFPQLPILLTSPNDTYRYQKYINYHTEKAQEKLYGIAQNKQVAFWDFFKIMGGLKSIAYWQKAELAQRDRVHLSQAGYELQGQLFFEALDEAYKKWQKKRK